MDLTIWDYFQRCVLIVTLCSAIIAVFEPIRPKNPDGTSSLDGLGQDLKALDGALLKRVGQVPALLTGLFDDWFTPSHFSKKCFRRSAIISIIAAPLGIGVIFAFVAIMDIDDPFLQRSLGYEQLNFEYILLRVLMTGLVLLSCNVVIDYISFFETRVVLRVGSISRAQRYWVLVFPFIAIIDLMITTLIIVLGLIGAFNLLALLQSTWPGIFSSLVHCLGLSCSSQDPVVGALMMALFMTTYASTIWSSVFGLGILGASTVSRLVRPGWRWVVSNILDPVRYPLAALGVLVTITGTILSVALAPVFLY